MSDRKGWVVGFDLSLKAPGAVAIPIGWRPGDWKAVKASLLKTETVSNDDERGQLLRYKTINEWVLLFVNDVLARHPHCYVFRESYGFRQNTANGSRIMESGGIVCFRLFEKRNIVVKPIAASSARKFLLGFNPSKRTGHDAKSEVQAQLFRAGAPKTWDENVCDAFVIANYALTEVGAAGLTVAMPEPKKAKKAKR